MATVLFSLLALPLLIFHHFYSFLETFKSPLTFLGWNIGWVVLAAPDSIEYFNPKTSFHSVIQHSHFTDDKIEV